MGSLRIRRFAWILLVPSSILETPGRSWLVNSHQFSDMNGLSEFKASDQDQSKIIHPQNSGAKVQNQDGELSGEKGMI
jgi:hypothetical protein